MKAKKTLLKILTVLLLAACVFALYSCNDEPEAEYTVSYMVDGEVYHTQTVKSVDEIQILENPSKEGYTFDGWYLDENTWENIFSASYALTENISVYAKFTETQSGDNGGNGDNGGEEETHTHSLSHIDAKPATCTENGNIEYWSCSSCGKSFLDANASAEAASVTIPAAHSLTHHEAVAASCTAEGVIEYWSCSACTKNFSDSAATTEAATLAVAKAAHTLTHHDTVAATCTAKGSIEYWSCSVCEKNFSDVGGANETTNTVVTFLEHSYGDGDKCLHCGEKAPTEGLLYSLINNGTAYEVSGIGTSTDTDIVIFESYNELPVTSIGPYAFYHCTNLESITIPSCVTNIGSHAFYECESLESVNLGENSQLSSIGTSAFAYCSSLTSITIPDNVIHLDNDLFYNCERLESISFGENTKLESIGFRAFYYCTSLNAVHISNIESWLKINFGNEYSNPLCYANNLYVGGTLLTELTVPSSVTAINAHAFHNCINLKSIRFEDNNQLSSIGDYAFAYCTNLKAVSFGENTQLGAIETYAFLECKSLTSMTIPSSVTSIASGAFFSCIRLVEIYNKSALAIEKGVESNGYSGYYALNIYTPSSGETKLETTSDGYVFYLGETSNYLINYVGNETNLVLPESYKNTTYEIYKYAFYSNNNIVSIIIPSNIKSVGDYMFSYCTKLESISFGESSQLTSIGEYAFYGCISLKSVSLGKNSKLETINSYAFYCCVSLENLNFGKNSQLKVIDSYAFFNCTSLTSIAIPSGVTGIGSSAFRGCTSLKGINIPASVTSIGHRTFDGCTKLSWITFADKDTWYRTTNSDYSNGTTTDVTFSADNATYFKSTYIDYYWYKK